MGCGSSSSAVPVTDKKMPVFSSLLNNMFFIFVLELTDDDDNPYRYRPIMVKGECGEPSFASIYKTTDECSFQFIVSNIG